MVKEILNSRSITVVKETLINNKWLLATITTILLGGLGWIAVEVIAQGKDIVEAKTEQKATNDTLKQHEETLKSFEIVKSTVTEIKARQESINDNIKNQLDKIDKKLERLNR